MKSLSKMIILSMLIAFSLSAFSQNSNSAVLSEKDQQVSNQFKSFAGKDRINLFRELQHLIKVKESNIGNNSSKSKMIGVNTTTTNELLILLGTPTKKTNENTFFYNLKNNANSCKVIIKVDKDGLVVFCTIKVEKPVKLTP